MRAEISVEIEREADGRWIAEVMGVPGALAYGTSQDEALAGARAIALHIIADRRVHGEALLWTAGEE